MPLGTDPEAKSSPQSTRRFFEQLASFGPQSSSQFGNVVDGDVALAALDRTNVGAVQPGEVREFFLGDPALGPQSSEIQGQNLSLLRDRRLSWHTMRFGVLTTLRLQT